MGRKMQYLSCNETSSHQNHSIKGDVSELGLDTIQMINAYVVYLRFVMNVNTSYE